MVDVHNFLLDHEVLMGMFQTGPFPEERSLILKENDAGFFGKRDNHYIACIHKSIME